MSLDNNSRIFTLVRLFLWYLIMLMINQWKKLNATFLLSKYHTVFDSLP